MFVDNVDAMARAASTKVTHLNKSWTAFFVSAVLAGAYIGIGIVLIFSLGESIVRNC